MKGTPGIVGGRKPRGLIVGGDISIKVGGDGNIDAWKRDKGKQEVCVVGRVKIFAFVAWRLGI